MYFSKAIHPEINSDLIKSSSIPAIKINICGSVLLHQTDKPAEHKVHCSSVSRINDLFVHCQFRIILPDLAVLKRHTDRFEIC